MKKQILQIKLLLILTLLCSVTAIHSQVIAPTDSAASLSFSVTQPVPTTASNTASNATDCEAELATERARVLKLVDAFEKQNAVIAAQASEITALKDLDRTRQAQIAARDELITFYQKSLKKSKWQKAFERIEKYGTLAAGIWIGTKL